MPHENKSPARRRVIGGRAKNTALLGGWSGTKTKTPDNVYQVVPAANGRGHALPEIVRTISNPNELLRTLQRRLVLGDRQFVGAMTARGFVGGSQTDVA